MGEAENELRDLPRRIARERVLERVPTIALSRDSLVFPYVDARPALHVSRLLLTASPNALLRYRS
jgi:hypothetical protein